MVDGNTSILSSTNPKVEEETKTKNNSKWNENFVQQIYGTQIDACMVVWFLLHRLYNRHTVKCITLTTAAAATTGQPPSPFANGNNKCTVFDAVTAECSTKLRKTVQIFSSSRFLWCVWTMSFFVGVICTLQIHLFTASIRYCLRLLIFNRVICIFYRLDRLAEVYLQQKCWKVLSLLCKHTDNFHSACAPLLIWLDKLNWTIQIYI